MAGTAFLGTAAVTLWRCRPAVGAAAAATALRRCATGCPPPRHARRPATAASGSAAAAAAAPPPPPPRPSAPPPASVRAGAPAAAAPLQPPRTDPPRRSLTLAVASPAATERLGAALGTAAAVGDVLLLHGPLGCGKTTLARGYVRAAVGEPGLAVTSPTYLLDNVYTVREGAGGTADGGLHGGGPPGGEGGEVGSPPLAAAPDAAPTHLGGGLSPGGRVHHMDLWRLPSADSRAFVDWEEVYGRCVALIEWPDRLGDGLTPACRLDVVVGMGAPWDDRASRGAEGGEGGGGEVGRAPREAHQINDWGFEEDADAADDGDAATGAGGEERGAAGPAGDRTVTLDGRGAAWVSRLDALRRRVEAGEEPLLEMRST